MRFSAPPPVRSSRSRSLSRVRFARVGGVSARLCSTDVVSADIVSADIVSAASVSAGLVALGLASLVALSTGCGARSESRVSERSSALGASTLVGPGVAPASKPTRTREGRASQLRQLAHDVGVMEKEDDRPEGDAGGGPELSSPSPRGDAGSAEPPSDSTGPGEPPDPDAGSSEASGGEPAGDGAPPPLPPPPGGLPRDIVAQSALPIYGLEAGVTLSESALWDRLASSSAVCFGELHDVPAHHYAQTRALHELAARAASAGHTFAVGFEMIQRPYQAPLSAFVAGELGEQELLAQTEYFTRWGYDFALYRPLFEAARAQHAVALALNMRAEITRKIGRTGLESLSAAELAELPELDLTDEEHRAFIFGLFGVLPEHGAELGLEDIYVAQTVWDETMADTSARWLAETGASARLLDIAGGAHCHRSAIPRRITRRTPDQPALSVHATFESELTDGTFTPEGYDVLVVLDD